MINGRKVVVVMPAYNAEQTLRKTYMDIPFDVVDEVVLVDDASSDDTVRVAREIGINKVIVHDRNLGYGGNQKTCYRTAIELGADIIIMVHPDYQYTPKLITAMCSLIAEDLFDCVLGSRILGVGALNGGMPLHKYIANRFLTLFQNILVNYKLTEYHTGYRAFSREVIESLPLDRNSDDFIFDNQMLLEIISQGKSIGEITCPTLYMAEASSISGIPVLKYGLGVIFESMKFSLSKLKIIRTIYSN